MPCHNKKGHRQLKNWDALFTWTNGYLITCAFQLRGSSLLLRRRCIAAEFTLIAIDVNQIGGCQYSNAILRTILNDSDAVPVINAIGMRLAFFVGEIVKNKNTFAHCQVVTCL
jgi:hypothetical protein